MPPLNHEYWIKSLLIDCDGAKATATKRSPIQSHPILITTLPILELGIAYSDLAHALHTELQGVMDKPAQADAAPALNSIIKSKSDTSTSPVHTGRSPRLPSHPHQIQSYEIMRAIEKKDIMFLMEARDSHFDLLVQTQPGGVTPLVHAMRAGPHRASLFHYSKRWSVDQCPALNYVTLDRDIAILLTGAISREVNKLSDMPTTTLPSSARRTLKAIRASLKIAIAYGLSTSQTELLSSYLQVIVMSGGEKFVKEAAQSVGLSLRAGGGQVVQSSERLVERWVMGELKDGQIAAVSEFIANATQDIVLLALWGVVTDNILDEESIPLHFFARDDRILK